MKNKLTKAEQLGLAILDDIRTGIYCTGDELPSIRELCRRYSMSKQTVSLALADLNRRGILHVAHGKTTRITGHPEARRIELIYSGKASIDTQEFWKECYNGIKDELSAGLEYEFGVLHMGTEAERFAEEKLMSPRTCGVIMLGVTFYDKIWNMLEQRNLPIVRVYDYNKPLPLPSSLVSVDFHGAIDRIVKIFKAQGRRRIAFFGIGMDNIHYRSDQVKYECFLQVMAENGLGFEPHMLLNQRHNEMAGAYESFTEMLRQGQRPDAIVLGSDMLAPGVYRAAHDAGLKIPDDLAVTGFDNLTIGKLLIPSLTSIDQGRYEMGKAAVRRLLDIIAGRSGNKIELTQPKIVFRESLAEPAAGSMQREPTETRLVTV